MEEKAPETEQTPLKPEQTTPEDYSPEDEYKEHIQAVNDLGEAATQLQQTQRYYENRDLVDKLLTPHRDKKRDLAEANEKVTEAQATHDSQLEQAATHIDAAHEHALGTAEKIANYKETTALLKEALGLDLPEKSEQEILREIEHAEFMQKQSFGEYMGYKGVEDLASMEAMRDALTTKKEVPNILRPGRTRKEPMLRQGIGMGLDEAAKILEQQPDKKALRITTGLFWRGEFDPRNSEVKYVPLSDELLKKFDEINPSRFNVQEEEGYIRPAVFDIVDADEVLGKAKEKTAPIQLDVEHNGGDIIAGYESEDEARAELIKQLAEGAEGKVTVNGKEMSVSEFILGQQPEGEPQQQAA